MSRSDPSTMEIQMFYFCRKTKYSRKVRKSLQVDKYSLPIPPNWMSGTISKDNNTAMAFHTFIAIMVLSIQNGYVDIHHSIS